MCPYGEKMCGNDHGCYCQRCWDERTKPAMQPCGYCDGTGQVETRPYDSEGRVNDGPEVVVCEYCDGVGMCEEGDKLLPSAKTRSHHANQI